MSEMRNLTTRFVKSPRGRRSLVALLLALLAILIAVWRVRYHVREQYWRDQSMRSSAEEEMNKIQHKPSSIRVQHDRIFKGGQGSISSYYQSKASYDQLRDDYDLQFIKLGWNFKKESHSLTWGKDMGEITRYYCKGPLGVDLYYTGNRETELQYRYAIEIGWGLLDCP